MEKQKNNDSQSFYCYENSNVLINKFNIRDSDVLHEVENMIVAFKLTKVIDNETTFKRNLSMEHYMQIHKYLFEDIYDFAGELRKEFTNKKEVIDGEDSIRIYCNPDFIYRNLKEHLATMKLEATKIKNREDVIKFLVTNYFELYYIHPFREGNSRTLREFLRQYVEIMNRQLFKFGNFELDYTNFTKKDNNYLTKALVWNISSDVKKQTISIEIMIELMDKCLIEKDNIKQK